MFVIEWFGPRAMWSFIIRTNTEGQRPMLRVLHANEPNIPILNRFICGSVPIDPFLPMSPEVKLAAFRMKLDNVPGVPTKTRTVSTSRESPEVSSRRALFAAVPQISTMKLMSRETRGSAL